MDSLVVYWATGCSLLALGWYLLRAKWWRRLVGWTQVPLLASIVQALLPSALHRLFGLSLANHGFLIYYRVTFVDIGAAMLWWLYVFQRVQRDGRLSGRQRSAESEADRSN